MSERFPSFDFDPITKEQIADYAEASGDHNQIHLDPGFARAAGLPDTIAHGMLSMGLAASALEKWKIHPEKLLKFESKFKDKVFPGDILRAEFVSETTLASGRIQIAWNLLKSDGTEVLQARAEIG